MKKFLCVAMLLPFALAINAEDKAKAAAKYSHEEVSKIIYMTTEVVIGKDGKVLEVRKGADHVAAKDDGKTAAQHEEDAKKALADMKKSDHPHHKATLGFFDDLNRGFGQVAGFGANLANTGLNTFGGAAVSVLNNEHFQGLVGHGANIFNQFAPGIGSAVGAGIRAGIT
jgi:hypothetical protein